MGTIVGAKKISEHKSSEKTIQGDISDISPVPSRNSSERTEDGNEDIFW